MLTESKYICITDFEATCWDNDPIKRREMEIIEIGSVLVETSTLKIVAEYDRFVKPVRNPVLTDFCKSLTTIKQEQVDKAEPFPLVLKQWVDWMGNRNHITFASWGRYDYNQLIQDCNYHRTFIPIFVWPNVNIKTSVADKLNCKPKGVGSMLDKLGIKFEGIPHRGIDDAKNILKIVQKVYGKPLLPR